MFCRNCAELLADTDITCPRCGFAVGSGVKYCGTCGSIVEPGAVVCELCGNPLNTSFNGQQAQAQYGQQYARQQAPYAQQQAPYAQQQAPYAQQQAPYAQQQAPYAQQQTPYPQQGQSYAQQGQSYAQQNPYAQPYGQTRSMPDYTQQQSYTGAVQKSKAVAGVLGILFGALGIHNFYLGYNSKALVQLLMTLFSCGALSFISAIWGLVEGIMILTGSINTDGKGIPLKD